MESWFHISHNVLGLHAFFVRIYILAVIDSYFKWTKFLDERDVPYLLYAITFSLFTIFLLNEYAISASIMLFFTYPFMKLLSVHPKTGLNRFNVLYVVIFSGIFLIGVRGENVAVHLAFHIFIKKALRPRLLRRGNKA